MNNKFKNIDKKYRPIPFWSWNEKLNPTETKRQINLMNEAGIGGYFMHARGGLMTEYMGEEWFENISVGISEGRKHDMQPWAYDENGWPSGFGNGTVNELGTDYQQKYLRYDSNTENSKNTIAINNGLRFYYEVNPYYVDTLDSKVTNEFIKNIYQPYYDKYGNTMEGFFTDEPQISRNGIPWSFVLPEEYKKAYGENLIDKLIELFKPIGSYEDTRFKFWRLVTVLFSQNFMKPIYDWCTEHNIKITGHLVCEESLYSQLTCNGACMPHYEYFHMPGMDWLSRRGNFDCFTPLQVSSVAHQLGKKEILSETFALCGHNVSFDELKEIYEWQMVHGITKLCQHLEGYSLRGLRKRDYPPAMYYQQPWWDEYKIFNDSMSRIGMLLSEGDVNFNVLLLHNQSSAWVCYSGDIKSEADASEIKFYNDSLKKAYFTLEEKHIPFHFGDEIIMERHAFVDGDKLVIGNQRYSTIVVPKYKYLGENTKQLLIEFENNGGIITTAEQLPANPVCDNKDLIYTTRNFPDFRIHYFVNKSNKTIEETFSCGNKFLNIKTGDVIPFYGKYKFAPHESLIIINDNDNDTALQENPNYNLTPLDLSGTWNIKNMTPNILTIDCCDVYFDGELVSKNENAVDVIHMALQLKRPVHIMCDYSFMVEDIPSDISLVCETPEKFTIKVNGEKIQKTDVGYFSDKSFRILDLERKIKQGFNSIVFEVDFTPSSTLLSNIEKALQFESEKNKLTFDTEIESIYLIGDFSVKTNGVFCQLEKNALRYNGDFSIAAPIKSINPECLTKNGLPFFAGELTLSKNFDLDNTNYCIKLCKTGINVLKLTVNGIDVETKLWEPYEWDISNLIVSGRNQIEITVINNLRNMLGPHHLPEGESYAVCPIHFHKQPCVWTNMKKLPWDKDYCFVNFGFNNKETNLNEDI